MAINNQTLLDTVPGTTETILFTSGGSQAITVIYLCNNDSITRTVDLHVKPSGEAIADENRVYKAISINAGDTFIIDVERLILDDTDEVTAVVGEGDTSAAITSTISSVVI